MPIVPNFLLKLKHDEEARFYASKHSYVTEPPYDVIRITTPLLPEVLCWNASRFTLRGYNSTLNGLQRTLEYWLPHNAYFHQELNMYCGNQSYWGGLMFTVGPPHSDDGSGSDNSSEGGLDFIPNKNNKDLHSDIMDENVAVGLMFASKAIIQLIATPFIGSLTN